MTKQVWAMQKTLGSEDSETDLGAAMGSLAQLGPLMESAMQVVAACARHGVVLEMDTGE